MLFGSIDRLDYAANEAGIFRKIISAWEPGLNYYLSQWISLIYNNAPAEDFKNHSGLTVIETGGYCVRFANHQDEIMQIWLKGKLQLFSIEPKKNAGKRFIKHYLNLRKPEYLVKLNNKWVIPMRIMLCVASLVEANTPGVANILLDMAEDNELG